jgi:hypothetical protein
MTLNSKLTEDISKSENVVKKRTENAETEKINGSIWMDKFSFKIALLATFTALAVVFGYMLAYIPNIEIFTLTIFLSGFILGNRWKTCWLGILVGLFSSIIFTLFNPLGISPPPLFLYQVVHYSFTGLIGGLVRQFLNGKRYFKPEDDVYRFQVILLLAFVGGIITFIYDFLSTFFGAILFSQSTNLFSNFLTTYISGIIFTTIHLIGNILGFIFILPGLIQIVVRLIE